jgi:hypothetical protein
MRREELRTPDRIVRQVRSLDERQMAELTQVDAAHDDDDDDWGRRQNIDRAP